MRHYLILFTDEAAAIAALATLGLATEASTTMVVGTALVEDNVLGAPPANAIAARLSDDWLSVIYTVPKKTAEPVIIEARFSNGVFPIEVRRMSAEGEIVAPGYW